jgi:hypothetical protein
MFSDDLDYGEVALGKLIPDRPGGTGCTHRRNLL